MEPILIFLVKKRRLDLLSEILEEFRALYWAHKNILPVQITSASPFNQDQLLKINQQLQSRFKKDIKPTLGVDSELIGGFQIKVKDQIFDFSLRSQLLKFKNQVMSV